MLFQFSNHGSCIQRKPNRAFRIIREFRMTHGTMYTPESSAKKVTLADLEKKMSTISSNFLDNALYRKMHYP